jgi:hypothetical protein
MGEVARHGVDPVVPYAAMLYDHEGATFVYQARGPLSFVRTPVVVDRIDGARVLLTKGPAPGTKVVTVGAAEVWGTEQDVAGSH